MKIQVRKKTVYGKDLYYPDCDLSKIFAEIAGQKTLTIYILRRISELGYEIELNQEIKELKL